MSPKRILNILPDRFPPELRVENAAQGLAQEGFEVRMMARPSGIASERWSEPVFPIDPAGGLGFGLRRAKKALLAPLKPRFNSNLSQGWILKQARSFGPDAIIWNDLAGAHIGLEIARSLGAKFILDLHENYPYNMWSTARDRKSQSRVYSLSAWLDYERQLCDAADLILTPAEEMNERLNAMHFTKPEKMLEILNSEDHRVWDQMPKSTVPEMAPERAHLLYVGSASVHRGLDVMVRAVGMAKEEWPELMFTIVGAGRAVQAVSALVKDLKLGEQVQLLGSRPFSEMASFIEASALGVVPHYRYGQTDNTLPHKLFQFAAMSKPVLVSNCKSLARITEDHGLGLVFKSGNAGDAAAKLLGLKDKKKRDELGARGRKAIEGPLNLRKQQAKLAAAVEDLLA